MVYSRRWGGWVGILALLAIGCAGPLRMQEGREEGRDEGRRQAMQYFIRAKVFESEGNYMGAIVALRNAADLDSQSATVFAQLAYNYRRIDDLQMAAHFARKGLELDSSDTRLRRFLIQVLERRGEHEGAVVQIEELLAYEKANWPLYRHLAYLYLETGQSKRIAPLFDKILNEEHVPADVKTDIAAVYMRIGERERAEGIYKRILAEDPDVEDAWLGLAELKLSQGRRDEGMQIYLQAARQLPESSLAVYYLARLVVAEHDVEEILNEEAPALLYRLGVALSDAGKFDLATLLFKRIISMQPRSVEGWLDLARYYIYLDDYDELDAVLGQAAGAMPDSSEIYLFWGTALERGNRHARAIEVYQKGLQRQPQNVDFYTYWGIALEQQAQWEEAIALYDRAQEQVGRDAGLFVRKGICLGQLGSWQEALAHYAEAIAVDSEYGEAYLHWGIALQELERWGEALDKFKAAVRLLADEPNALFYLASCYEQASRAEQNADYFARAVETFKHLIALEPEDAFALNYLGYMYAEKGIHLQEAVELLLRAIEIDPGNSAFLDSLGWAYFRLGEYEQAEQYLQRALQHSDDDDGEELAVILDHAGDIATAQGKKSAARKHWQRALELDPNNDAVRGKLKP